MRRKYRKELEAYDKGYRKGYQDGYDKGRADGYDDCIVDSNDVDELYDGYEL